ncbi:papilin-like protein 2 [Sarcoptes scabiei]|uniref:Papilin n=1 Tax=Sarcoptes scabiei TaxID=52283 RepID=A0A132AHR2_SARSC|nr:papilin-like protein 2 [Sarcoptes scabiei]
MLISFSMIECPPGTEDFRSNQCARFNRIPFDGRYYYWQPYYKGSNAGSPCELNCKPENERFYYRHSRKVIDGTRCYDDDSNNICVDGVCIELGCDRVLGSNLKEDNCRVCGGDGYSCRKVTGIYDQNQGLKTGYNDILYLPVGSVNIRIQEIRPTNNYLAIRGSNGQSYLNGKWRIQPPSTYEIAGTKFHYDRPHGQENRNDVPEKLRSLGPIKEPLFIQLLHQEPNQGISFEYSIPLNEDQNSNIIGSDLNNTILDTQTSLLHGKKKLLPRYVWIFGDFSKCSKTCGIGTQRREVYCAMLDSKNDGQTKVADSLCDSSKRPSDNRPCHNDPCPAKWIAEEWSECSCTDKMQFRNVYCSSGSSCSNEPDSSVLYSDSHCSNLNETKPLKYRKCQPDLDRCPQWTVSSWSECDAHCGLGKQTRKVLCGIKRKTNRSIESTTKFNDLIESTTDNLMTESITFVSSTMIDDNFLQPAKRSNDIDCENDEEDIYVEEYLCDADNRPVESRTCSIKPCDETGSIEWVTSSWSSCDKDCGSAKQTRKVVCVTYDGQLFPDSACESLRGPKPDEVRDCIDGAVCSKPNWLVSEWSQCSEECGEGIQTRHVFCAYIDDKGTITTENDESKCSLETKPPKSNVCYEKDCQTGRWFSGPYGPCTVSCGSGQQTSKQFCLMNSNTTNEVEISLNCQEDLSGTKIKQCNLDACDADQLANLNECKDSPFGCCPSDNVTSAEEDFRNCKRIFVETAQDCIESEFGCCSQDDDFDEQNFTLALGPFGLGCPVRCKNTRFGCCPDSITPANSTDMIDCPDLIETTTEITSTTFESTTITTTIESLINEDITTEISALKLENCVGNDCVKSTTPIDGMIKDCSQSQFGCCPDGWNRAAGPDGEGCEEGSGDVSFYSSTPADVMQSFTTESEVSTIEIDCSLTEFGCCPNGKKAAIGPRYYGCTCHDYPYGCCQDGFSPASGNNLEGCFCERMLFGCCADGLTPAVGPNQQGCDCETSTYGCCSDMVTFAKGPNYHGCPCDTLTYGCCPGSHTPARGPDFAGCSCADTPFGCCPDGTTVAYGPKFEGCPSGLPLDTKLNSEVCKLPMEAGPCSNFSVMWFFDNEYGTCNRFWYSGCRGNGNRFSSQVQCERSCVKPEGPERCLLPKVAGPCNSSSEAYYFDEYSRRCEKFLYGGCLGNNNRFETLDQCVQTCIYHEKVLNQCEQPLAPGPCRGSYRRWYYRREDGRCHEFSYGGCQGNLNNFQTEDECQSACASRTPFEICTLPKAQGSCLGSFPRWFFDSNQGACVEFTYTGCSGNKNRFIDRISCEKLCNQTIPDYYFHQKLSPNQYPLRPVENEIQPGFFESICALPKAIGPCKDTIIQWYFDVMTRRCERFYYGGCGGNENRFDDRDQCERKCLIQASQEDPCLETKDLGNPECQNYQQRWYYDIEDRRCHRFYYYGCGGNRNNFESDEECTSRCVWPREQRERFEYHHEKHQSGAESNFDSIQENTLESIGKFSQEHCSKQYDAGPCEKNQIQWYYDFRDGVCKEFVYGGCGGNENRFRSQQECQTKCWNSQDICKLSPVRGSCSANFTQWFYDPSNNECLEFEFSGCYGNANRFSSKETCEQQCKIDSIKQIDSVSTTSTLQNINYPLPERCSQSKDAGPCKGYFQNYYYSPNDNQCQLFIYGGCGGNQNRFDRLEECEQTCRQNSTDQDKPRFGIDQPEVICNLKMETGPCHETQAKWWYDPNSHTCFPFVYGGCKGNKNRFEDFEQCMRFCSRISRVTPSFERIVPMMPVETHYDQSPPQSAFVTKQITDKNDNDCKPMECNEEMCVLGIDYFRDARGCPACRCINPCNDIRCSSNMNCAVELFRDEITGKIRANAECRLKVKPGSCPTDLIQIAESERDRSPECLDQCRLDADCRGLEKCCHNGCADVCIDPNTLNGNQNRHHNQSQHSNYYGYAIEESSGHHQASYSKDSYDQSNEHRNSYNQQHNTIEENIHNPIYRINSYDDNDHRKFHNYSNSDNGKVVQTSDQHIYHFANGNHIHGSSLSDTGVNASLQSTLSHSQSNEGILPLEEDSFNPANHELISENYNNQNESSFWNGMATYSNNNQSVYNYDSGNDNLNIYASSYRNQIKGLLDQEIVIDCPSVTNKKSEQIQWIKDGKPIQNERVGILENGSLVIKQLKLDDRGMWGCMVMSAETEQERNHNVDQQVSYTYLSVNGSFLSKLQSPSINY